MSRKPEPDDFYGGPRPSAYEKRGQVWAGTDAVSIHALREARNQIAALPPYRDAMWGPFFGGIRRDDVVAILDGLLADHP